jgi:hypothetical protein
VRALSLAVLGEHLIRYTHEVVIPRIDEALREIEEERAEERAERPRLASEPSLQVVL